MAEENERLKEELRRQLEEVKVMKRKVELKDTELCDAQAVLEQDKTCYLELKGILFHLQ